MRQILCRLARWKFVILEPEGKIRPVHGGQVYLQMQIVFGVRYAAGNDKVDPQLASCLAQVGLSALEWLGFLERKRFQPSVTRNFARNTACQAVQHSIIVCVFSPEEGKYRNSPRRRLHSALARQQEQPEGTGGDNRRDQEGNDDPDALSTRRFFVPFVS